MVPACALAVDAGSSFAGYAATAIPADAFTPQFLLEEQSGDTPESTVDATGRVEFEGLRPGAVYVRLVRRSAPWLEDSSVGSNVRRSPVVGPFTVSEALNELSPAVKTAFNVGPAS